MIPQSVIEEAISWMVILQAGNVAESTMQDCLRWRASNTIHEQAWQQLQAINQQIVEMPKGLTHEVLNRDQKDRRAVLKSVMLVAGVGALSATGYRYTPWQQWMADYGTAVGEQSTIQLADGTQVMLNTDSAIDIAFTSTERRIQLLKGEIYITSGHDHSTPYRPLTVQTVHGNVLALGTRFIVHHKTESTWVSVLESAVEVNPLKASKQRVRAGESIQFDSNALDSVQTANPNDTAWIDGVLIAKNMRLDAFVDKLDRYFKGKIRCDESVSDLAISGVFPVNDIPRTIEFIQNTLPVRAAYRTRYWITLTSL